MHPVLVAAPGVLFKIVAPAAILWGLYSLVVAYNRRALRVGSKSETTATASGRAPADSPTNAVIAIAVGIGLFLFSAPVTVGGTTPFGRLVSALRVFARSVIDGHVWSASWTSLPVHSYGVMLGSSLVLGWYVTRHYATKQGIAPDVLVDCFIVTVLAAFAGSRALYVITNLADFRDPETHRLSVASMLALRTGGLVAYGGFLGGLAGSWWYLRRRGVAFWPWGDAAAPSLALGLGVTRIGCYLFGCDFGKPLGERAPSWLKRIGTFPRWSDERGSPAWLQHRAYGFRVDATRCIERFHGDLRDGRCFLDSTATASAPVHPTQLYESALGLAMFALLVWVWRRRKFEGEVLLVFGAVYGLARAGLEVLRDDNERGVYGGWSTSQIIGVVSALACAALWMRLRQGERASGNAEQRNEPGK